MTGKIVTYSSHMEDELDRFAVLDALSRSDADGMIQEEWGGTLIPEGEQNSNWVIESDDLETFTEILEEILGSDRFDSNVKITEVEE